MSYDPFDYPLANRDRNIVSAAVRRAVDVVFYESAENVTYADWSIVFMLAVTCQVLYFGVVVGVGVLWFDTNIMAAASGGFALTSMLSLSTVVNGVGSVLVWGPVVLTFAALAKLWVSVWRYIR